MAKIGIIPLGWLGLALSKELISKGHEVIGTYFSHAKDEVNSFQYDINNPKAKLSLLDDMNVIIINIPPSKTNSLDTLKDLIKNFKHKKIIFISSTSVYGMQGHVDERVKPTPDSPNGKFLLEIEDFLMENHSDFVVIRSAGQYGEGRHPGKYLSGKENIKGANLPINLISQKALIKIIIDTIDEKDIKIINAVNNHHPQKIQYYTQFCEEHKIPAPVYAPELQVSYKKVDTYHDRYMINSPL